MGTIYFALITLSTLLLWSPLGAGESLCPRGRFGPPACAGVCHCQEGPEVCNVTNGNCSHGGCTNGYTEAPHCQTSCSNGTFGKACAYFCHCPPGDMCNSVNGLCSSLRCSHLWTGPACQIRKPQMSTPPHLENITATSLGVRWVGWSPSHDHGDASLHIDRYSIQCQQFNRTEWQTKGALSHIGSTAEYSLIVDRLLPDTQYRFRLVLSWWDADKSIESIPSVETHYARTLCAAPSDGPEINLDDVFVTQTSVHIAWKVPEEINCEQISHYVVYMTCIPACGEDIQENPDSSSLSTTLTNLLPDTEHRIFITAINDAGLTSPPSHTLVISANLGVTLQDDSGSVMDPQPTTPPVFIHHVIESYVERPLPADMALLDRNSSMLVLRPIIEAMEAETSWGSYLSSFQIAVEVQESTSDADQVTHPTINTSSDILVITTLQPATLYNVALSTRSIQPTTKSWQYWTTPPVPPFPPEPEIVNVTQDSVRLMIAQADTGYSKITSYLIIVEEVTLGPSGVEEKVGPSGVVRYDWRIPSPMVLDLLGHKDARATHQGYYVAANLTAKIYSDPASATQFVIGDGHTYGSYDNEALRHDTQYVLWYVTVHSVDRASVLALHQVSQSIETLPATLVYAPISMHSQEKSIIIGVTTTFVLLAIVLLVFILLWYKRKKAYERRQKLSNSWTYQKAETLSNFSHINGNNNSNEGITDFRSNTDIVDLSNLVGTGIQIRAPKQELDESYCIVKKTNPILTKRLRRHIDLRENSEYKLADEFKHLPQGHVDSTNAANQPQNMIYNRSAQVVPFDKNKVKLSKLSPDDRAYINASFVHSICKRYFIVTQSPMSTTTGEFWRMVWEQKAGTIVMLMTLAEKGKPEYERYWPERQHQPYLYHNIEVEKMGEDRTTHYIIRSFKLVYLGSQEEVRYVKHWQFLPWVAGGTPFHPIPFLDFVRRVQDERDHDGINTVVHCHTGGGRSGLYVALDSLLIQGRQTGRIDILQCVTLLRTERVQLVRTLKQYKFLHECLAEAFDHSETRIPLDRFMFAFENIIDVEGKKGYSVLQREFDALAYTHTTPLSAPQSFRDYSLFCSPLKLKDKKTENPLMSTMLHELDSDPDKEQSTFLDGFLRKDTFLLSKPPSLRCVEDFWDMVFEHGSRCIVMLNNQSECAATYWPTDGGTFVCGQYRISPSSFTKYRHFLLHNLQVTFRDKSRIVHLYEYVSWAGERDVPSVQTLVDLVARVKRWWVDSGRGRPVVVHSSCGPPKSRGALFAVVWGLVERLDTENVVDVFSATRFVRAFVAQAIPSLEQYRLLYRAVREVIRRQETAEITGCGFTPATSTEGLAEYV